MQEILMSLLLKLDVVQRRRHRTIDGFSLRSCIPRPLESKSDGLKQTAWKCLKEVVMVTVLDMEVHVVPYHNTRAIEDEQLDKPRKSNQPVSSDPALEMHAKAGH